MDTEFNLCGQKWKPVLGEGLRFFLAHSGLRQEYLQFSIELKFVPPWLDDEDFQSEHRTLYVDIEGELPQLGDWRELAGFELEGKEAVTVLDEVVIPGLNAPEIDIWSCGHGPIHTHA